MALTRTKKFLAIVSVLVAALLISGAIYEHLGRHRDKSRLPQIGKSVDIGGRSLNIFCSGSGSPTVVFESGGEAPGLSWQSFQSQVATFTQACWYDRAGIGWSDPGPYPRTSEAICRDLHELLKRAGIPPPYILVGASFGGLNSRVYGGLYPQEVAGIVLVDSAHEDESLRAPKFYLGRTLPRWLWHPASLAFQSAANVGLIRLFEPPLPQSNSSSPLTPDQIIAALRRQPKSVVNNVTTGIVLPESYAQARAVATLGDHPLIVLTASQPPDFGDPALNQQALAYQQIWIHEMQAKLATLSTRGRQIVVPGATHGTIPDEVVLSAIRDVLTQARN